VDVAVGGGIYPNSVLYSVEQLGEDELAVVGALAPEAEVDETLTEYEVMVSSGSPTASATLDNAVTELSGLEAKVTSSEEVAASTASTDDDLRVAAWRQRFVERVMKHRAVLERVRAQVPEQAHAGVDRALFNLDMHYNLTMTRFDLLESRFRMWMGENVTVEFNGGSPSIIRWNWSGYPSNKCRFGVVYPEAGDCVCPVQMSAKCKGGVCGYACALTTTTTPSGVTTTSMPGGDPCVIPQGQGAYMPNPAAYYCGQRGYPMQDGRCQISDGTWVDEWSLYNMMCTSTTTTTLPNQYQVQCQTAGGHWNECGSRCAINMQGQGNTMCPAMCEALCECGGIAGWQCPTGRVCDMPEGVVDALGVCEAIANG
jgi:hypothetical protein